MPPKKKTADTPAANAADDRNIDAPKGKRFIVKPGRGDFPLPEGTVVEVEGNDDSRVFVTHMEEALTINQHGMAERAPVPRTLGLTYAEYNGNLEKAPRGAEITVLGSTHPDEGPTADPVDVDPETRKPLDPSEVEVDADGRPSGRKKGQGNE